MIKFLDLKKKSALDYVTEICDNKNLLKKPLSSVVTCRGGRRVGKSTHFGNSKR